MIILQYLLNIFQLQTCLTHLHRDKYAEGHRKKPIHIVVNHTYNCLLDGGVQYTHKSDNFSFYLQCFFMKSFLLLYHKRMPLVSLSTDETCQRLLEPSKICPNLPDWLTSRYQERNRTINAIFFSFWISFSTDSLFDPDSNTLENDLFTESGLNFSVSMREPHPRNH